MDNDVILKCECCKKSFLPYLPQDTGYGEKLKVFATRYSDNMDDRVTYIQLCKQCNDRFVEKIFTSKARKFKEVINKW